jgi:alkylation response protein AidB-like acyl-CoA dehydrogenase
VDFDDGRNDEGRDIVRRFLREAMSDGPEADPFEWRFDWAFYRRFCAWYEETVAPRPELIEVVAEELDRAGIEARTWLPSTLVADIVAIVGTEDQRHGIVQDLRTGKALACLGYSEPDSGSDVAAARTRAVREDDSWVINGEKMFTSNAGIATHVFLLTRTDPDLPKHKGLTMFLLPMDTPGVDVRPVQTLRGHPTFMTSYVDVRVPDDTRIGAVNDGWGVMRTALDLEHGAGARRMDSGPTLFSRRVNEVLRQGTEWARTTVTVGGALAIDQPDVRVQLAKIAIAAEVTRLLCNRNDAAQRDAGVGNGSKLYATEAFVRCSADLLDLVGSLGPVAHPDPGAVNGGWIENLFRDAPVSTIAGGSSEVQRDIIAQRRLGLPVTRSTRG